MDPKEEEKVTPNADGLGGEKTPETGDDTPKTDVPEVVKKVEVDETELSKLKKKAEDFDNMIESKRIAKLQNKGEQPIAGDELKKELEELKAELQSFKTEKVNDNLKNAYSEFIREFPWANSDDKFNKISENFSAEGLSSKESIIAKLKATAINLFPTEYAQHEEKVVKSKALADATKISLGDGGSNSGADSLKDKGKEDPLAKLKERFASSLPKGYTAKK